MSKLFQKLALVQSQLKAVPENGHNKFHGYSYATHQDIVNSVRPLCASHGLFLSITCSEHTILKDGKAASVVVTLTVTDCESGESTSCSMPGYAEDAKSDKSLWKALTGSTKYALRSLFCLSTTDDPENEGVQEHSPSAAPPSSNGNGRAPKPVTILNTSVPADSRTTSPRSPQAQDEAPAIQPAGDGNATAALLEATTSEMTRLGWDVHQGREYLDQVFGQRSRKHLTPAQLRDFLEHLRSLPTVSVLVPMSG